ncbi:MAG: hypothetical protein H6582_02950 [Crocinitomicaceae bacterium]|nr:hypothetical protein [Crocinitomicaceae bacterium]
MSEIAFTQSEKVVIRSINIGDSTLQILQEYGNTEDSILFINVHEDEVTSIETVYEYSTTNPVHFVRLKHKETRRVEFTIRNKAFSVDPNRIYTKKGRRKTLRDGGKFTFKAAKEVRYFAEEILTYLSNRSVIIAMHNNTDVNYSIKSYLPGGDEAQNTKEIFINPDMDPDDFVYTTEKEYFDKLKERNINVILQDNKKYVNDGSLSVYCGLNGIPYINIEAQKGHFEEQMFLIREVMAIL